MGTQQFSLRWNNHQTNLLAVFDQLLQNEAFVDVTLACDGLSIKAHKMVLSACSPYFQALFIDNPCKHPIVILKDVRFAELKAVVDFMYRGEVNVSQDQLSALLKTAETLKVKGLAEVSGIKASGGGSTKNGGSGGDVSDDTGGRNSSVSPPPAKRKRRTGPAKQNDNYNKSEKQQKQQGSTEEESDSEAAVLESPAVQEKILESSCAVKVGGTSRNKTEVEESEASLLSSNEHISEMNENGNTQRTNSWDRGGTETHSDPLSNALPSNSTTTRLGASAASPMHGIESALKSALLSTSIPVKEEPIYEDEDEEDEDEGCGSRSTGSKPENQELHSLLTVGTTRQTAGTDAQSLPTSGSAAAAALLSAALNACTPTSSGLKNSKFPSLAKAYSKLDPESSDQSSDNFRCTLCSKTFEDSQSLIEHSNLHLQRFECDVCGTCFANQRDLRRHEHRHIPIHLRQPQFECQECGKRFHNQGSLVNHRNVHKERFKCNLCGHCSQSKVMLEKHMRIHLI